MTQATTTHTNNTRRAHPAVVRAALRSRIAATTDNTGQAIVYFTTGKQSGFANNVMTRERSIESNCRTVMNGHSCQK